LAATTLPTSHNVPLSLRLVSKTRASAKADRRMLVIYCLEGIYITDTVAAPEPTFVLVVTFRDKRGSQTWKRETPPRLLFQSRSPGRGERIPRVGLPELKAGRGSFSNTWSGTRIAESGIASLGITWSAPDDLTRRLPPMTRPTRWIRARG